MTDAVRRRARTRARVIRVQWLIILVLAVALIVSLATRPRAVNGNVIDIYFDSHESACEYGVQYKTIYIKGE